MKHIDPAFLRRLKARVGRCEVCGRGDARLEVNHVVRRGMGNAYQLDTRLTVTLEDSGCHNDFHDHFTKEKEAARFLAIAGRERLPFPLVVLAASILREAPTDHEKTGEQKVRWALAKAREALHGARSRHGAAIPEDHGQDEEDLATADVRGVLPRRRRPKRGAAAYAPIDEAGHF